MIVTFLLFMTENFLNKINIEHNAIRQYLLPLDLLDKSSSIYNRNNNEANTA